MNQYSTSAEDICLKDQNDSTNTNTEGNPRSSHAAESRPKTTNATSARNSPEPVGLTGAGHALDFYTLGSSGIASGHHHAYLPDPWVAVGSHTASAATGQSESEKQEFDASSGGDDNEKFSDGPVASATDFGSFQGRYSPDESAPPTYVSRPPSSASASSVSIVGSMAQAGRTASLDRPEPLRLVRSVVFNPADETKQAASSEYRRPASSRSQLSSSTSSGPTSPPSSSSATVGNTPPHVTFPEGGLQAWLVVFASFSTLVSVFGIINTASVFESWFATHQLAEYTASEIGWVFSLYLFLVFFVGIQVGPIFDRHGPRYLVALGSVMSVTSVMLLGFCEQYYQILLCYSVLGGLGGALLNTPAYACIAHFFNVRRGLATGIASASGGVGGIVFPILLQQLLPRLGFPWTTRILAFILLGLSIPSNLWLRTRLPLPGVNDRDTEESGAPAAAAGEDDGAASVRTGVTGRSSVRSHRRSMPSVWPDFSIVRDRRYAAAAAGIFFMEWGIFVPLTFIVAYATAYNQTPDQAYILLSLLNAGSVVGRVLPGFLADKLGRFNIIISTIFLSSASIFCVWLPAGGNRATLMAFSVLFGFVSGSNLGLIAVCVGQLCEPSHYGRYYSTAMMVASFGTLSSGPIGGALVGDGQTRSGWTALIIFSGASYAMALVCYITARIMAVGWRPRAKF
ncbi:hypothetical protein SEPCBS119000_006022 [Sporothrix epigloea]|uniref:Major facilitator superfamily (MFS) profile domain-containing protein n=1 Tax=Sporothrix epigloea TaxID=1892477 RepID=A0ABP0E379_9PEZI